MADYDFEAWAQSRVASSKPNPNQQAASSMQSVGIGGLGGRTTTAAAQRVQDQFSMFRDDDDRGSTYDYVPQTVTSGLGTPLTFPKKEKEDDRNIDQKIYDGMVSFGARFFGSQKESTSDYVLDVYETSPMFRIPTVPEVTELGIEKSFEQKLQEMFDSQGQNVYTPEIEGTGSYDEVPAPSTNKNLMRNRINNILKDVIAPNSKEYEIQKGDTLSDISLREGVRVEDLAQVNEIENPNMILEGGTLIIPEAQEMEKAKEYVLRVTTRGDESLVDLTDPDAQFYQSGVPMDQRDFAPEDMTGFAGMGPDPSVGKGIMSPPSDTPTVSNVDAIEALKAEASEAQKLLGITVDGDFGRGSKRAIASFQYKVGLPVSGKIDPATMKALRDPDSADPRKAKTKINVLNEDGDAPDMTKVKEWAKETIADPLKAAAFVATVEAETGERDLVEIGYDKERAIEVFVDRNARSDGTLGPKMTARKAAIEALPSNYSADDIFDIVYGNRLGNDQPTDGSTYKGRGLIMITGKDNYKRVGEIIGVDLVANPELVNDPQYAAAAAMAYLSLAGKDFFAKDITQASLADTVGHSDDADNTEAKARFDRAKELKEEMYD